MAGAAKISDRLERFVDSEARSLARAWVSGGRVKPQKVDTGLLNAKVEEALNRTFVVWVRLQGTAFSYDCNCPAGRAKKVCGHIFAAVLQAESMGVEGFRVKSLRQAGTDDEAEPPRESASGTATGSKGGPAARSARGDAPASSQPAVPAFTGRTRLFEIAGLEADGEPVLVRLSQWWQCADQSLVMPTPGWDQPTGEQSDERTARALTTLARAGELRGEDGTEASPDRIDALRTGDSARLDPTLEAEVLQALCESGRAVRPAAERDQAPSAPMRFRRRPYRVVLRPRRELADGTPLDRAYAITAVLRDEDSERNVDSLHAVTRGGVVRVGDELRVLEPAGLAELVIELRRVGGPIVEVARIREFLSGMYALPIAPELDLPPELAPEQETGTPVGQVLLARTEGERLRARLRMRYGAQVLEEDDPRPTVLDRDHWSLLRRSPPLEAKLLAHYARTLETAALLDEQGTIALHDLPALCGVLGTAGFEVFFEERRLRVAKPSEVVVTSGVDWFDVHADHDFGDGVELGLPELLEALDANRNVVELPDGSIGLLTGEWLSRAARLLGLGRAKDGALRFDPSQAVWLDPVLDDASHDPAVVSARVDEAYARVQASLRDCVTPHPEDPAPNFLGELRPYQREGLGWLRFLAKIGFGGILADDMGLGKTVQVLAHLHARRETSRAPALVVAPRSVVHQWAAEAKRFTPHLHVDVHVGTSRAEEIEHLEGLDLVVTSYGVLRRDVDVLAALEWDVVVLDEAQAVKNESTQTAKAVRRIPARQRLVVTGTPIENHLGELAQHLDFANPGLFGKRSALRERFTKKLHEDDAQVVARALRPLLLRRTKAQVARDLPERIEQDLLCEMEGEQDRLYQELREHYTKALLPGAKQRGVSGMQIQVLEALLRLRQAACHPALVDEEYEKTATAKFDVLLPRLEELVEEGGKALVFSQFTKYLGLLRRRLDRAGLAYEYLDGATTDRPERVRRFQEDPDVPLFLISLKAGGVGLNLTAAQYVFLLDPWWNPAVEAQAIDRAHRHGQTSRVVAYRLIAKGTVEEKIRELQRHKRELAESVLGGEGSVLRAMSVEDLETLLS